MTTYTRINTENYIPFIVFDDEDIEFFKEINNVTYSEDEVITVDPNNCIKVWTYDNSEDDAPSSPTGSPYIFSNQEDMDNWFDYNNSDGHKNCPYYGVIVKDGVETVFDPY